MTQDDDAANLADWIGEKNIDTDGATTQEFDQFLAERAAAGDTPRKDKWSSVSSDYSYSFLFYVQLKKGRNDFLC